MAQKIGEFIRDEAFLIRSVDYGDHHRILHWLSAHHGRVHLMAYAARKSQSRLLGLVDYLHCLRIEFKLHPRNGMGQLVRCELVEDFGKIRQNYSKTLTALRWLRILSHALQEGGHVTGLFGLLYENLQALENKEEEWVDLVFLHHALARLGYLIELSRCVRCGVMKSEEFTFFPEGGGLFCAACREGRSRVTVLSDPFPPGCWSLQQEQNPWPAPLVLQGQNVLQEAFRELLGIFLEFSKKEGDNYPQLRS